MDVAPGAGTRPGHEADAGLEAATLARVSRRLLPFLFVLLVVNYLDRVNIGFAALRMNRDLGFGPAVFGFGAGVFFVGYALFEVPSNLALHRFGARLWLGRIMVSWGVVSGAMALVQDEAGFYALRFVLGVAEAGFLPGVVYYLTGWFPAKRRARAIAGVVVAIAISPAIGSPLSGAVMQGADGAWGLHGWQWMFLVEALPAVLLGVATLAWLPDRPRDAAWLAPEGRAWLEATLDAERAALARTAGIGVGGLLRMARVWRLVAMFSCLLTAFYSVLLWLPQIVAQLGHQSDLRVGLLAAIPYGCAAVAMLAVARSSDRSGERRLHVAGSLLVAGLALLASVAVPGPVGAFLLLCVVAAGLWGALPLVWTMAASFLTGAAAASGIALVNTLAQVGGFAGPWMVGLIRQRTGSFADALLVLAGFALAASAIAASLREDADA